MIKDLCKKILEYYPDEEIVERFKSHPNFENSPKTINYYYTCFKDLYLVEALSRIEGIDLNVMEECRINSYNISVDSLGRVKAQKATNKEAYGSLIKINQVITLDNHPIIVDIQIKKYNQKVKKGKNRGLRGFFDLYPERMKIVEYYFNKKPDYIVIVPPEYMNLKCHFEGIKLPFHMTRKKFYQWSYEMAKDYNLNLSDSFNQKFIK